MASFGSFGLSGCIGATPFPAENTTFNLRAGPRISAASLGVEAPAWQGARSAHTGRMQATSNAARRDASAARMMRLFSDGPLSLDAEAKAHETGACSVS